jgi:hypothetical protein
MCLGIERTPIRKATGEIEGTTPSTTQTLIMHDGKRWERQIDKVGEISQGIEGLM